MSEHFDVVMVGGGNMGTALLTGMVASGDFDGERLAVVELIDARRDQLADLLPSVTVVDAIPRCDAAVIAVKPGSVADAVAAAVGAGANRVLSIAAGVTLATLQEAAGDRVAVIRSMPNTPALVGEGMAAISPGASASDADLEWAERVLGAVGKVERLPEPLLDVFTGLAGSGPAYVFLVAEALIDAAVTEGLERAVAERVVSQLLLGSSTLLARHGDPAQLRVNVTSPGGTTAAGLERLDHHAVRAAFADAVRAATERSRELS